MELLTTKEDFDSKGRKRIKNDKEDITIFNVNGVFFACNSKCPHRGGPLFIGKILTGNRLMCPSHHIIFNLTDGKVLENPIPKTMGEYSQCLPLKVYEIREREETLEILIE
jgi:nitrite reductase/ring-hydroxylating ferredoxin subunit